MITYIRFRKALVYNNLLDTLPFRTPLQPYFVYFVLGLICILTLTNGFQVFFPSNWSAANFLAAYITIPIFLALYIGHKIVFRTAFAIKIQNIDVTSGKREMDEMCARDVEPVPRNIWERMWFWVA